MPPLESVRVLLVVPSLAGGGAERVIVTLLERLDRSRFEPHLALMRAHGPYLKEIPADVPVHDLAAWRVRTAIPALVRLTRRLRPQATLSTLAELNLAMCLARPFMPRRCRLLLSEQVSPSARLLAATQHPGAWRWLYRHLYPRADAIVCVSDEVLNDLAEQFGIPRRKLARIYNPVDVGRLSALAAGPNPYIGDGPHLVAAGRLHRQKGFDLLLDAMPLVRARVPTAELTILGEGALEAELKSQRDRLGLTESVHFLGFQENPYPFMKHCNLFVLPSRYEGGASLVAMEALALGRPVVAADCPGGVRELLAKCPLARFVPIENTPALAAAIIEALECGGGPSAAPDVESCLDPFRAERVVRQYEAILSGPVQGL